MCGRTEAAPARSSRWRTVSGIQASGTTDRMHFLLDTQAGISWVGIPGCCPLFAKNCGDTDV